MARTSVLTTGTKCSERRYFCYLWVDCKANRVVDSRQRKLSRDVLMWSAALTLPPSHDRSIIKVFNSRISWKANRLNVVGEVDRFHQSQDGQISVPFHCCNIPIRMNVNFFHFTDDSTTFNFSFYVISSKEDDKLIRGKFSWLVFILNTMRG